MKQKRGRYWANYTRTLANQMKLWDWTIFITKKPERKEFGAGLRCTYGRKIMELSLSPKWESFSPDRQRHYLVHELCHVHFWGVTQAMANVRKNVPKRWVQCTEMTVSTAEEYGVDAMAEIIGPTMPLPPTKEQDAKRVKAAKR